MNLAPLLIAGVAVLTVAGYMIAVGTNTNLSKEIEFNRCIEAKHMTPNECITYVNQLEEVRNKLRER